MKKRFLIFSLLLSTMFMCACGQKNEVNNNWDTGVFGDIDVNAEVVDNSDFNKEYDLNEFIDFEDKNSNSLDVFTEDTYRLYWNRKCESVELQMLDLINKSVEKETNYWIIYEIGAKNDINGIYLYKDLEDNLLMIKNEINISYETTGIEEDDIKAFKTQMAKLMVPIYAGVPYLTNYELNEIFNSVCNYLKNPIGSYAKTINGVTIEMFRDSNWCTVTLSGYTQ